MFFCVVCLALSIMSYGADYYVSPGGSDDAAGTIDAPFATIAKAITKAAAGTTIYLREGTYTPAESDIMTRNAESAYDCIYSLTAKGTAAKPITICAYEGEKVTIDCSAVRPEARVICFYVKADYWRLKGFDIIGLQVTQTGHTQSINVALMGGSNCIVEQVNMHDGMGIGVYATRGANNLVLNCDAYNNYDPVSENGAGGNCDGFGFHLNNKSYTGCTVRGCRAWRNSDDGFDLINNLAPVVIEDCWAWENGYDANRVSRGDGTGFKSGGYGMSATVKAEATVPRNIVRGCVAWANKNQGFYANHHLGGLDFVNNSAYANRRNFNMVNRKSAEEAVDVAGYGHYLKSNVAYAPTQSGADCINFDSSLSTAENNSFFSGITLAASDFESLNTAELLTPRNADGSLPAIKFMRLKESSPAYAAGMGWQFPYSDESGVAELPMPSAVSHSYFNMQGIAVEHPAHGMYIFNGKKIYVP